METNKVDFTKMAYSYVLLETLLFKLKVMRSYDLRWDYYALQQDIQRVWYKQLNPSAHGK